MRKQIQVITVLAGLSMVLLLAGFTTGDLPPRPTPVPTAVSPITVVPAPNGEQIQLHLENEMNEIPADLWTVVE